MSGFAGNTPVLRVVLENPFSRRKYPAEGAIVAVMDTGYEGFAAVPPQVFRALSLDGSRGARRHVRTADGREVESRLAFSSVVLPDQHTTLDGQLETLPGLSEVLVGTAFLAKFRFVLDYCLRASSMAQCR